LEGEIMDEERNTEKDQASDTEQKKGVKKFFQLGEVAGYYFRKKDPSRFSDINIRMMHGINKISIIVFLLGIIYIILRRFL
jgi:hypothetical protein